MRNRVETHIAASPAVVWKFVGDFATYPAWNPFTPKVEGKCAAGELVQVTVRLGGEPFTMPRRVLTADADKCFCWTGAAWYSVFTPGQRSVTLQAQPDGSTLVIDDEYVGGISWMMSKKLCDTIRERMEGFGAGLKAIAEAAAQR